MIFDSVNYGSLIDNLQYKTVQVMCQYESIAAPNRIAKICFENEYICKMII